MEEKIINGRPVKIWTREIEETAMEQIENLTTLPFLYHHLAIMPDVHARMGMPIGGVLACTDAVVPLDYDSLRLKKPRSKSRRVL